MLRRRKEIYLIKKRVLPKSIILEHIILTGTESLPKPLNGHPTLNHSDTTPLVRGFPTAKKKQLEDRATHIEEEYRIRF